MKPIVHAADCISFFTARPGPCDCRAGQAATDNEEAAAAVAEARAIPVGALGAMDDQPLIQALERAGFAVQLDAANQSGAEA